jgi:energy-coupling factor transporter transmembrane protein EcfT
MFFVESMRLHNARYAFLGLISLTFAEITRMGSVFTIPTLALWIAITFGENLCARARLFALACGAVIAVLLVQTLCAFLYGNPASTIGGNFSYVICGLASGGDWTTCPKLYAQEFGHLTSERDQDGLLYSRALSAIIGHPSVLASGIIKNIRSLLSYLPDFAVTGYRGPIHVVPVYSLLFLVPGLIFTFTRNRARGELSFWFLMLVSIATSAAVILGDDGWRTLSVTWPFLALLLSLGFTSRDSSSRPGIQTAHDCPRRLPADFCSRCRRPCGTGGHQIMARPRPAKAFSARTCHRQSRSDSLWTYIDRISSRPRRCSPAQTNSRYPRLHFQ